MSGIEGKVIAITGASSGIGEATAQLLAERGAKVVLGARGTERLEAVAARIADRGGDAVCVPIDVRRRADIAGLEGQSLHVTPSDELLEEAVVETVEVAGAERSKTCRW